MKCNISKEQLIGYLYKETDMDAEALSEVETHLESCSSCQKELADLSAALEILDVWPEEAPDLKLVFVDEERAAGRGDFAQWWAGFGWTRFVLTLAASIIIGFTMMTVLKNNPFQKPASTFATPGGNTENSGIADNDSNGNWQGESPQKVNQAPLDAFTRDNQGATLAERGHRLSKSIDLMATIMDHTLHENAPNVFEADPKTSGVYLEGKGAVFLVKPGGSGMTVNIGEDAVKIMERLRAQRQDVHAPKARDVYWESEHEVALVENLVQVVGDYGHTLRSISPDESIVLAIDMARKSPKTRKEAAKRCVLEVNKKDLDRYHRGLIKRNDFQKVIKIRYFD